MWRCRQNRVQRTLKQLGRWRLGRVGVAAQAFRWSTGAEGAPSSSRAGGGVLSWRERER